MGSDFFEQLDAQLAQLTRQGAHLTGSGYAHRRWSQLLRRSVVSVLVVIALAASLVSEFPATASGHAQATQAVKGDRL